MPSLLPASTACVHNGPSSLLVDGRNFTSQRLVTGKAATCGADAVLNAALALGQDIGGKQQRDLYQALSGTVQLGDLLLWASQHWGISSFLVSDLAYEMGIPNPLTKKKYGAAHNVLLFAQGVWLILVDVCVREGCSVGHFVCYDASFSACHEQLTYHGCIKDNFGPVKLLTMHHLYILLGALWLA